MIEQNAHLCTALVACVLNIACSLAETRASADCSALAIGSPRMRSLVLKLELKADLKLNQAFAK